MFPLSLPYLSLSPSFSTMCLIYKKCNYIQLRPKKSNVQYVHTTYINTIDVEGVTRILTHTHYHSCICAHRETVWALWLLHVLMANQSGQKWVFSRIKKWLKTWMYVRVTPMFNCCGCQEPNPPRLKKYYQNRSMAFLR